jgi:hypothetical protein
MDTPQLPIDPHPVWPPTVRMDGVDLLREGLAVAWSTSVTSPGLAGDRLAAARAAASAVARVSGCAENDVALSHRTGAAPIPMLRHAGATEPLPCAVSIAHSAGHAVAAADTTGRVGVDLERAGTVSHSQLRLFASPCERALGIDPTTLWTLKEAAWKAFSCDDATPFQALTVAALEAAPEPMYIVFGLRGDIVPGFARIWHPWPGWLAALVEVA